MSNATASYYAFQAGGNHGGDEDHMGNPVVDGAWYVVDSDHEVIVAGPFDTERECGAEAERMVRADGKVVWEVEGPDFRRTAFRRVTRANGQVVMMAECEELVDERWEGFVSMRTVRSDAAGG
jgi:hypothetical protein